MTSAFGEGEGNAAKPPPENTVMSPRSPLAPKLLTVLVLTILGICSLPTAARSQGRGSLQVTATVVAASASVAGLQATQQAVSAWAAGRTGTSNDVATLAQVDVGRSAPTAGSRTGTLVVEVDYLKN
jgi:hypothetical protein